jgi:hypothetical protein
LLHKLIILLNILIMGVIMKRRFISRILPFFAILVLMSVSLGSSIDVNINDYHYNVILKPQKIQDSVYKLLIITPDSFSSILTPLVNHKEKYDISTKVISLSDVYDQMYWYGRDEAEKIKYFIKFAIEEWGIQYVLLIGGKKGQLPYWHLPVRYVNMDEGWEPHYISDLYFADIYDHEGKFSSWDSDNDGVYGEWIINQEAEDKYFDMYPDIAVGRIPCRNKLELKIMVNKIIDYETNTFDKIWFNDMIVIAGDTYPESHNPNWTGYEGEYYAELALENMSEFNPIRLFTSDGTLSGQRDVIRALNGGCGFVYFVGHGNPKLWGNHPPDDSSFIRGLSVRKMHKLKNKHMYPVCIVSGCHNSQFDVSILKYFNRLAWIRGEAALECWGWRMTRKIGGGSIATIGCTALGYTKEDKISFKGGLNELEVEFFKEYGQNKIDIVGDTWAAAVSSYLDKYPINWDISNERDVWIDTKVAQSWALFGDPSLKIGGYPQS